MHIELAPAIQLLHTASHAVLSTRSLRHPGYPYGTAVPLVTDECHRPVLLLSDLAEHTRNLLADSRASLAVVEPAAANVQDAGRLTLVGRIEPFRPEATLVDRYLRYLPEAGQYLQLDFRFFRLMIEDGRHIGGVGRMGWLDAARWQAAACFSATAEAALMAQCSSTLPGEIELLGIDPYGVDIRRNGLRQRLCPAAAPLDAERMASHLPSLLSDLEK